MTWRAIVREAIRNVGSGTARSALLAVAFALAVLAPLFADQVAVRQLVTDADAYRAAGAATLIIQAASRIDGDACDRLGSLPGVRAAGAARQTEPIETIVLPSAPIPAFEVTAGYPVVLHSRMTRPAGVVLAEPAADDLGAQTRIATTDGHAVIAGTYPNPDDGRRPGLGYAALIVTTDRAAFDECWVDAWPQRPELAQLLLTTVRASNDPPADLPTIGQFNSTLGAQFDGAARFDQRLTRFAPLLTGVLAASIAVLAIRLRRIELASARHSGVRARDLLAIAFIECATWIAPVAVAAAAVAACFAWYADPGDRTTGLSLAAGCALAGVVSALVGTAGAVLATRERHLFRYFKDR